MTDAEIRQLHARLYNEAQELGCTCTPEIWIIEVDDLTIAQINHDQGCARIYRLAAPNN